MSHTNTIYCKKFSGQDIVPTDDVVAGGKFAEPDGARELKVCAKTSTKPYRSYLQFGQYLRRKFQSTVLAGFLQLCITSQSVPIHRNSLYARGIEHKKRDLHIPVRSGRQGNQAGQRPDGERSSRRTSRICPSAAPEETCTCGQDSGGP